MAPWDHEVPIKPSPTGPTALERANQVIAELKEGASGFFVHPPFNSIGNGYAVVIADGVAIFEHPSNPEVHHQRLSPDQILAVEWN